MSRKKHRFMEITHGWWFYRSQCTCGWKSVVRWQPKTAEADLMVHQYREHEQQRSAE